MADKYEELGINKSDGWVEVPNFLKGVNDGDVKIYLRAGSEEPTDNKKGLPLFPNGSGLLKEDITEDTADKIYAKVDRASSTLAYVAE